MAITNTSPNIENYFVGKGIVKISTDDGATYRDIGNVPEFEFTPELDKLEHFSSRTGVRTKDRTIVREKSATIRIVMEEMTADNLGLVLLGAVTGASSPYSIDIFSLSEVNVAVRFIGQNDVGAKIQLDFPNVSLQPSGSFTPISDEWGQMEISGEVLADVNGVFGTALWDITAEVP